MAFNAKAFATGFLDELTKGIKERGAEAKELLIEEKEKADRNIAEYKERIENMDTAKRLAGQLMDLGATEEQVMYYAKDKNPVTALRAVYTALSDMKELKSQNVNYPDLTPDLVSQIMDVPADFKPSDEQMEDFWKRTFNLTKQHESNLPSDTDEGFFGNILFAAMNINARERVMRKLEEQKYLGDYSIADINRIAASKEYSDVFSGEYAPATMQREKIPPVVDYAKLKVLNATYTSVYEDTMKDMSTLLLEEFGIPLNKQTEDEALNIIDEIEEMRGDGYARAKRYSNEKAKTKTISDFGLRDDEIIQVPILATGIG
jgi:hypothetical protein